MKNDIIFRQFADELIMRPAHLKEEGIRKMCQWAIEALQENPQEPDRALQICNQAKRLRYPFQGLDHIRAISFLCLSRKQEAYEAVKEELRWFPHNTNAQELLEAFRKEGLGATGAAPESRGEFDVLYHIIRDYTMVGRSRLRALHLNAKKTLLSGIKGNFVECGVAGGGSSGLLAKIIKDYGSPEVHLFSCDSFSGMPEPTEYDVHAGEAANAMGWGSGTCAAPEANVLELCSALNVTDRITLIKGYFEETLPAWKEKIGPIAFLHMDGDWYSSTKTILENLYDQLIPGAYVQIDDYGYWDGCRKAVHEFFAMREIMPELRRIDGSGVSFSKLV